jgi:hypothetical protein
MPAGGRALLLMGTMLVRVGGHGWVPRLGCSRHHSLVIHLGTRRTMTWWCTVTYVSSPSYEGEET